MQSKIAVIFKHTHTEHNKNDPLVYISSAEITQRFGSAGDYAIFWKHFSTTVYKKAIIQFAITARSKTIRLSDLSINLCYTGHLFELAIESITKWWLKYYLKNERWIIGNAPVTT